MLAKRIETYREYRNSLQLFNVEEKKRKSIETISALDLFRINEKRFVIMRNILKPVLSKLEHDINIQRMYFSEGNEEDLYLNIDFISDDKEGKIILDNSDYDDNVEFVLDSSNGEYNVLFKNNRKVIVSAFKEALNCDLDKNLQIVSTSKEFLLTMNLYKYLLENRGKITDNYIKIMYQYCRNDNRLPYFECSSSFDDINALLQDSIKLKEYLSHIRFYEEDVPMHLIKRR